MAAKAGKHRGKVRVRGTNRWKTPDAKKSRTAKAARRKHRASYKRGAVKAKRTLMRNKAKNTRNRRVGRRADGSRTLKKATKRTVKHK